MDSPCRTCQKRVLGCHSSCMSYKKYKEELEEFKKKNKKTHTDGYYKHYREKRYIK